MSDVNPRVDIAFKKIFGVEENKDLLISLINAIVSKEDQVRDITLLNPYNLKSFRKDKLSILDIKAEGVDGKIFNIEMQIGDEADYDKRALYYWAKLYTEQLHARGEYATLSKAIGIHILNFISIPGVPEYHNVFHVTEKTRGFVFFRDFELHTIELKKFARQEGEALSDIIARVKTSLDMWVTFLTYNNLLDPAHLPKPLNNPKLKKAMHVLEVLNFDRLEREIYESQLKWLRIQNSVLKKYGRDNRAEGRAEGRAELVQSMLDQGRTLEEISQFTGLSLKELKKLVN